MLLVFLGTLFFLLFLGAPVGFVLLLTSFIMMLSSGSGSEEALVQSTIRGFDNFTLMAIPFFMLAGEIMSKGGLSRRIVRFSQALIGFVRGGLGLVAVVASMIFAGISGSAVADTSAIGSILLPIMEEEKYNMKKSTALIAAAGTIGPIIPPSIPMILYGVTTGESITKLFLSGAIPGVLIGLGLMFVWWLVSKREGYPALGHASLKELSQSFLGAFWALLLPIIILGGILTGIYTPTEAAVIAVVYALVVSAVFYKSISIRDIMPMLISTVRGTAVVMFVCGTATAVAYLLTIGQAPARLSALLAPFAQNRYILLLVVNLLLLAVGMVMDLTPALLILAPILVPVMSNAGIDPLHFGAVMVINLCIGLITPPVGTVLYTACGIRKVSLYGVVTELWPFLAVLVAVLFLVTYVPWLALWLPSVVS